MGSFSALMRAKVGFRLLLPGSPGAAPLPFPWGYSCGRGNPKNKAGGCNTLWRAHRKSAAARHLPPHALPDSRRPPALPLETVTWYFLFPLYGKSCKNRLSSVLLLSSFIVPRPGGRLQRASSTKFASCNLRRMPSTILVQNCLCKFQSRQAIMISYNE